MIRLGKRWSCEYNHYVTTLLPTKFYLPPVPARFVARPQLLEKLDEALSCRLTLISAPAGAGKTTLVSAWVQSVHNKGVSIGWLSLDDADNSPMRFLENLLGCLEEGGVVIETVTPPSEREAQVQVEFVLADFIRGLITLKREVVLILDDYHLIQNLEVHYTLEYLLVHSPPRLHIMILTRSDPPLELARLRVAGQLVELRMDHLRFSAQEAAAFLKKAAGIQLTDGDVAALNERTEGWIAGLQMAAISMRGREDVAAFVAAFAGSHRFVFDYLLEQVLNHQTPEVRGFLLKTSMLERLSAPLCDAIVETGGSARNLLDILERSNLFLVPLDDERGWYRYHHLFADLLKLMLEQTYPGLSVELNRRACRWHESHGMLPDALHHAMSSGDMQLVAQVVSANVLVLVEHAELMPVLLRMDAVPREQRAHLPWLGIAHAWSLAYTGQMERSGAALMLAEQQSETLTNDERDRLMGHIAAVRAYSAWVYGNQQEAVDLAGQAARLLPVDEIAVRALNLSTLGNALTQYSANPDAVEVLEQALALSRQAGQSHVLMAAASALAYAYISLGRLRKAYELCAEAIAIAVASQRRGGQMLSAASSAYAMMASILSEMGEIEESIQNARTGLALSEHWGQIDTMLLCLLNLANSLSLACDTAAAQQMLQRARKLAQKVSPWFVLNVDQVELRILLDAGEIDQAAHLVTEIGAGLTAPMEVHWLVKQNRLDEALTLLERALPKALENPSLETVRLGISQSLAFYMKKDEARALQALRQTLALAEPEYLVSAFVREGAAMENLLRLALARSFSPRFVRLLLSAFETQRKPKPTPMIETLIEPLSERELEVLQHLNSYLSTQEIAEFLVVSANTVRTHIKNIYGKLGVHGRSSAVRRAKELGLLV
jgi:LuxR family maltose regulon positive regulatory protein